MKRKEASENAEEITENPQVAELLKALEEMKEIRDELNVGVSIEPTKINFVERVSSLIVLG